MVTPHKIRRNPVRIPKLKNIVPLRSCSKQLDGHPVTVRRKPELEPVELEVAPLVSGMKRLVIARRGDVEIYRDEINTNSGKARYGFLRTLTSRRLLPQQELRQLDRELIAKADAADATLREIRDAETTADEDANRSRSAVALDILKEVTFFRTPQDSVYVRIRMDGHFEHWPANSTKLRSWLRRELNIRTGKTIGTTALEDAIATMAAGALLGEETHEVHVRLAATTDAFYLDLGRADHKAAKITARGVQLLVPKNVRFERLKGLLPLPDPDPKGTIDPLFTLLNLSHETDKTLLAGVLVAFLNPTIPVGTLAIYGPHGAAKTFATTILKRLIDPTTPLTRAQPKDEHTLLIAARHNQLVCLDNMSSMPRWLSDALCRLNTGGGFGTRQHYTVDEEFTFDVRRPVIINGIAEVVTRSDLLDRLITLILAPIDPTARRTEADVDAEFERIHPQLLGALLNGVARAMKVLPTLPEPAGGLPRLADFTKFAMASMSAFGRKPEDFLNAMNSNQSHAAQVAVEASPIYLHFLEAVDKNCEVDDTFTWTTTAADLLKTMEHNLRERRRPANWPKNANALSHELRMLVLQLRRIGINVTFSKSGNRRIVIRDQRSKD